MYLKSYTSHRAIGISISIVLQHYLGGGPVLLLFINWKFFRTVRLTASCAYRTSAGHTLCKQLNLLKFGDIHKFQITQFMYNLKHTLVPVSCLHYCMVTIPLSYNMRSVHYFVSPSFRTNIRGQSISVLGPEVWNSLPASVQGCIGFVALKRAASKHFISLY